MTSTASLASLLAQYDAIRTRIPAATASSAKIASSTPASATKPTTDLATISQAALQALEAELVQGSAAGSTDATATASVSALLGAGSSTTSPGTATADAVQQAQQTELQNEQAMIRADPLLSADSTQPADELSSLLGVFTQNLDQQVSAAIQSAQTRASTTKTGSATSLS